MEGPSTAKRKGKNNGVAKETAKSFTRGSNANPPPATPPRSAQTREPTEVKEQPGSLRAASPRYEETQGEGGGIPLTQDG